VPAGTEADGDGIVIGGGPATVDLYIDFICPFCRQFEEASASVLAAIVAANAASLVYHPLGFLDRLSSTGYSSRAAAASGCASDGNKFIEYKDVLFRNQPEEGGAGLSDPSLRSWVSRSVSTRASSAASARADTSNGSPT
jgi:protein-disulfide isomerase